MEKFVVKKRNTAEKQAEETSAKKLKKDYDNKVEITETLCVGPSVQTSQIQKSSLLCTTPTDISTSGSDKPIQPHLKEYPKHSEGTSINMNALNILSNVMECFALLVDTLHQLLMAIQTMHL